jgi:homoserine kinase type II
MNTKTGKKNKTWVVYILRCADESLYTGITNNIEKRFAAHNQGTASKYTRSRRPVELLTTSAKMEKTEAMRLELEIKKLPQSKKIAALKKHAEKKPKSVVRVTERNHFRKEILKSVATLWQVNLKRIHKNILIQGSPERSVFRIVLEDENGKYFVLEQISLKSLENKKRIATTLDFFAKNNLVGVQPYLASGKGDFIIEYRNNFWQMLPFVPGVELDREKYIYDKWRGPALAVFLIDLQCKSKSLPFQNPCTVFSLKNYIYKLIREINLYNKDIKDEIKNVARFLEKDFMPMYEKLPVAFCHGDYHPLNVIWSADNIKCVIDWEFCGYKSELYDAANLIGCIGVEDPQSLTGDLVKYFIADMKKAKIISKKSWLYLLEFIVALRFAWLSEWLRREDTEMISLELDYMRLLIDNKNILQKAWL